MTAEQKNDPRRQKRLDNKKAKDVDIIEKSEKTIVSIDQRNITDIGNEFTQSFISFLGKQNRRDSLSIFENDPRIGFKVELLYESPDDITSKAIGLTVHIPVYSDGSSDENKLSIVKQVIESAAEKKGGNDRIDRDLMKVSLDEVMTRLSEEKAVKAQDIHSLTEKKQEIKYHDIALSQINGRPLTAFVEYMQSSNRATVFRAFAEKKDLGFTVKIKNNDNQAPRFIITIPKKNDRALDEATLNLAKLAIGKLRAQQEDGAAINLTFARNFLANFVKEQKESCDKDMGDRIVTVFRELAKPTPASNDTFKVATGGGNNENNIEPLILTEDFNDSFVCPVDFALPEFDDEGQMTHTQKNGISKIFNPTANQRLLIEAIMNPDIKTVFCQAPTGAGKTFWATYAALMLLQRGVISEIGYERPISTVGGRYDAYLKGGMDEKFGPFGDVLENVFAEHLGSGNTKSGMEILEKLKKADTFSRYDQLYKAGDNLKFKLVLADEAQNKDRKEIFHLITRPAEGGKMVLVGDGIDQDYLKKRNSGFLQAIESFSNTERKEKVVANLKESGVEVDPNSVAVITMGPEDIRRDPHTAFVYEMYKEMDREENKAQEEKEKLNVPVVLPPAAAPIHK